VVMPSIAEFYIHRSSRVDLTHLTERCVIGMMEDGRGAWCNGVLVT